MQKVVSLLYTYQGIVSLREHYVLGYMPIIGLILVSFLKLGIPLLKINIFQRFNTVRQRGSNGN